MDEEIKSIKQLQVLVSHETLANLRNGETTIIKIAIFVPATNIHRQNTQEIIFGVNTLKLSVSNPFPQAFFVKRHDPERDYPDDDIRIFIQNPMLTNPNLSRVTVEQNEDMYFRPAKITMMRVALQIIDDLRRKVGHIAHVKFDLADFRNMPELKFDSRDKDSRYVEMKYDVTLALEPKT